MSALSTALLSLSMSADAFAVSLGRGACYAKPRLLDAARTGAVFGCVEACAPVLGWLLGSIASSFIERVDHWFAFGILAVVGAKMIFESVSKNEACDCEGAGRTPSPLLLVVTAIGTSIDSMAVGVSLAFIEANILVTALCIGVATFTMSTTGIMIGHVIGTKLGRWAEAVGGVCLMGIGTKIVLEHLGVLGL